MTETVQDDDGSDFESPPPGRRKKRKVQQPSFSPDAYRFKKTEYNVAQDMYKE